MNYLLPQVRTGRYLRLLRWGTTVLEKKLNHFVTFEWFAASYRDLAKRNRSRTMNLLVAPITAQVHISTDRDLTSKTLAWLNRAHPRR